MTSEYSASALLQFLEYSLDKGLGKSETTKSRIASIKRIVDAVGEDELRDVREIDPDHIIERFDTIEGAKYSPGSLNSYKSRLKSAIGDFLRYKENPTGYRPARQRVRRTPGEQSSSGSGNRDKDSALLDLGATTASSMDQLEVPVPIRPDCIVRIAGLPHDLRPNEAARMANVINAMALAEE
ncbi:hypothetical protein [Roseovarius salis]|uniref:hypothetical protein n=1 Tax=Roseovarius salis TaxID=3376063 RepID=UPI0037C6BB31